MGDFIAAVMVYFTTGPTNFARLGSGLYGGGGLSVAGRTTDQRLGLA